MNSLANARLKPKKSAKGKPAALPIASTSRFPAESNLDMPNPFPMPQSPPFCTPAPFDDTIYDGPPVSKHKKQTKKLDVISGTLGVSDATRKLKVTKKRLNLQNPEGKMSDLRTKQKAKQTAEREKLKRAKIRGYKVRGLLPREDRKIGKALDWDTANGIRGLWLGYMSELLGLQLEGVKAELQQTATDTEEFVETVERYHAQQQGYSANQIAGWHTKLVKADYHGALIRGTSDSQQVEAC